VRQSSSMLIQAPATGLICFKKRRATKELHCCGRARPTDGGSPSTAGTIGPISKALSKCSVSNIGHSTRSWKALPGGTVGRDFRGLGLQRLAIFLLLGGRGTKPRFQIIFGSTARIGLVRIVDEPGRVA